MSKTHVKILCWDPKAGGEPNYKTYQIPYHPGDKVLGALIYIHRNLDPCLSFRFNCRARHCGECAITIDNKPGLSCKVSTSRDLVLEPLQNLPLAKDLVIQRTEVYKKIAESLPPLRKNVDKTAGLRPIGLEVVDRLIPLGACIHCLCCMSVCPVLKKRNSFIGPMGLLALAADLEMIPDSYAYEKALLCSECGRCEEVCPKGIPVLSKAIKKIKEI